MAGNAYVTNTSVAATTNGNVLRIAPEVEDRIHKIGADLNGFLTLTRAIGKTKRIQAYEWSWHESWPIKVQTTVNAAINASATTGLTLTDAICIKDRILLNIETGEQILCTASTSGQPSTIVRQFGTNAAAAWTAGDRVLILGSALEEGQDKPERIMRTTNTLSNVTQKMHEAFALTDRMQNLKMYGPKEAQRLRVDSIENLHKQRSRVLLFSQPKKTGAATGTTYSRTATGGVEFWCGLYNAMKMPCLTEDGIAAFMEPLMANGSGNWVFYTGSRVSRFFTQILARSGRIQQPRSDNTLGLKVAKFSYGDVDVSIVKDRNFDLAGKNDRILVVDADCLSIVSSESMQIENNVETPGSLRDETQITVCEGVQCDNPAACGVIYGVRQAA